MPLDTSAKWLQKARGNGYALAGFAAYNMETVQAVVEVAEELGAPVLIQTTPATIRNAGISYLTSLIKVAAEQSRVPVILHLDHGDTLEQVIECLRYGYTSVMIDGSALSFEENIRVVSEVCRIAHSVDVSVEAELGRVGGVEDDLSVADAEATYTDPEIVSEFVVRTGVDSLAVAIGTAHGVYKGRPHLELERLASIASKTPVPLVLHGASGVPDEDVVRAIQFGISKFNIATELKIPFAAALRDYFIENPNGYDPRRFLPMAKEAYKSVVREKILLSGSQHTI